MADDVEHLRYQVATACRILGMLGLVRESTGHVSARIPGTDERGQSTQTVVQRRARQRRKMHHPDHRQHHGHRAAAEDAGEHAPLEGVLPAAQDPGLADRLAERQAVNEAREARAAKREAAKKQREAEQAAEKARAAEAAAEAEREAERLKAAAEADEAEREILLAAEQKAARDARYAARKAAKKQRRKG